MTRICFSTQPEYAYKARAAGGSCRTGWCRKVLPHFITAGQYGESGGLCHASSNNLHIICSFTSSKICTLSLLKYHRLGNFRLTHAYSLIITFFVCVCVCVCVCV